MIDYGPIRQTTGCGISFQVVDLDGNGHLGHRRPGKDGLYVFKNLGYAENIGRLIDENRQLDIYCDCW